MVLIDVANCEVHAVSNIKDICAFIVQPMQLNDMKSMTNVLAGHFDDVYDSDDEEFNYRLGVQGVLPTTNLPLDGPFHDGQPVTWDSWQQLSTNGSFRVENPDVIREADTDFPPFEMLPEMGRDSSTVEVTSTPSMANVVKALEDSDNEGGNGGG